MPARMIRAYRAHGRPGYRLIGVVDFEDGATREDGQDALIDGQSENGLAARLWHMELPTNMLSPMFRDSLPLDQADRFYDAWNQGEELAIAYNDILRSS